MQSVVGVPILGRWAVSRYCLLLLVWRFMRRLVVSVVVISFMIFDNAQVRPVLKNDCGAVEEVQL